MKPNLIGLAKRAAGRNAAWSIALNVGKTGMFQVGREGRFDLEIGCVWFLRGERRTVGGY